MAYAGFQNLRGRLESSTWLLWVLMLAFPFPYIANTLGWMTAELGRQPWLVYGLFRTARRLQQSRQQRRHGVHADRLRRPLFCARSAVSVSGRSRDQLADPVTAICRPRRRGRGAVSYDRDMVCHC